MKYKVFSLLAACVLSSGFASAVTLQTNIFANNTVNIGFVTTSGATPRTLVTGLGFLYSSATELTAANVSAVTTRSGFEALIGADPGVVRSNLAITNGALSSTGQSDIGAVGNNLYLWLQSTDGGLYGLFKSNGDVPSLGTVSITSATMGDLIGTSVYQANAAGGTNSSGFQLIPEPSVALLGALGVLGLVRRRRI
jgi:hypothetical protein